jgi:UDP-glucose 4,6-dehydratase
MSLLITGGAGFIGSNVLCKLVNKFPNKEIIMIDKLNYCSSLNHLPMDKFIFKKGDITDIKFIDSVFKEDIEIIVHFAAETHVDNSFGNSCNFSHTNVYGTHVLLEAARKLKNLKKFIHVSTDEVYGESLNDQKFDEISNFNPTNPYAATKAAAEHIVNSYRISYNMPCIITRGNNVYGPRQYPEKLIPKFINLLLRDKNCLIHGNGSNLRTFIHVDDVAEAFIAIIEKAVPGEIYNIGSDNEYSVLEIANELMKKLNKKDKIEFVKDRNFNDKRYHIDSSKLKNLGWSEKIKFDQGLQETIDWYIVHNEFFGNIDNVLVAHPKVFSLDA